MSILASRATKVPRRAEQVPSALCLDATPERDISAQIPRSSAHLRGRIPDIGAPAPRFGAPAILTATPCALARFWRGSADIITMKIEL
jgi:hypothetical protein